MSEEPVTPAGVPAAEIEIDAGLVRALLLAQHPDLAALPLRLTAIGWDNMTYRLGERLAVRLPRIRAGAELLRHEQRWLPVLAGRLPVPVPVPERLGAPHGEVFPWPWSVVPWIPGRSAEHAPPAPAQAAAFGRFLAALHRPAPVDFPRNDWRGIALADASGRVEELFQALAGEVPAAVREHWREALSAAPAPLTTCVHGDLHPKNVVVDDGRLAAVLDWGDMTAGDPAIDLAAAWMLFPVRSHTDIWAAYGGVPAATTARAKGWTVFFGLTLLDAGLAGDRPFEQIGRATLTRLLTS
ncbi:aminoglycoside phosphotransferase family protein [Dactylosporangium matsuzakiense]|uniref:Aminoglycoside phosphotransferase n=1 Tax=Dactylosporangium matsuzakiense TaxID=53360 RepID=A0A9W6KWG1_9ACTN|nr:aminoglycoside phosphotransferase family protein [Dactylosporangium matsuzakiense]UWZ41344.1 aminoglycoside phosphotransferase family protein [Dactylosporangium matsuzakiense]GLL08497.1 aminoglycoside phosphotransferase [Dactylosporangium matsuzakiense]